MKHAMFGILTIFLLATLACRKDDTAEDITQSKVKTVIFPDGSSDLYYYDGSERVSAIYHSKDGITEEYTYAPGFYDVVKKDSTKNPSPGGYLRVELVNTLISSARTGLNGHGPRIDSFVFNANRTMSWRLYTPDTRTSEEYKYFYGEKGMLDSLQVYNDRKLFQTIVYEYDYRLKNALTNKNFGLIYHGEQSPFPLSFRKICRVGSKPVVEAYKYEFDEKGRISKMIITAAFGKPQVTRYTFY